ncbi:hypothetical protein QYE76_032820 [Lolium multiflorum]|uniref:Uncharacterized protein n=1 Tax=Lolium multiflorum TaxID=4521 RepID=A0AAD8QWF6_LOLMU|nr:hypothetical protein QYE76_032820 [Lolium multiflorum]
MPARRDHHALDAPEHGLDPSPPSSPTPLLLQRAPAPLQLASRHAQAPARAPSPSSSSTFRRQYHGRFFIIASDPIALLLRQLAVEHRHDASYATPSSPWPFPHRRRRAILDLHGHPQHLLPSINRALPLPISSHSSVLLPYLPLLEPITSQIIAGAAPICRWSPPVPADRHHRLEPPRATQPVPGASSSTPMSLRTSPSTAGAPMEQFTQTQFYQLGNGGGLVFEKDLKELAEFLGRPFPEFFGGQVNDQPGGQLQWVIIADLRGKLEPPMTERIQFSLRENTWADGLARAMREALARLCGQNLPRIRGTRFFHLARHDSMGAPMDLSPHPKVKHHVDHLDFMMWEAHMELDNSRAYANHTYLQMAQQAETIKILAKERKTLRRQDAKKDYTIARLRAKIASLKETVKAQEDQLKDLEGEGEDIQGDGYSYVSNDNDYEEEEDEDLAFHPYVDGYEHLEAGMDDSFPINVDEE